MLWSTRVWAATSYGQEGKVFRAIELFLGAEPAGPLEHARLAQFLASLERPSAVLVNVAPRRAP